MIAQVGCGTGWAGCGKHGSNHAKVLIWASQTDFSFSGRKLARIELAANWRSSSRVNPCWVWARRNSPARSEPKNAGSSVSLLNVRQYPVSNSAIVTVTTIYTGASADLIEGFITTPLEKQIASADGIDYIESSSAPGASSIIGPPDPQL